MTYIWKFLVYDMCDIHLENPGVGDCVMMCDICFGKSYVMKMCDIHLGNPGG